MKGITAAILFCGLLYSMCHSNPRGKSITYCAILVMELLLACVLLVYAIVTLFA
jgi:hypothetical protein